MTQDEIIETVESLGGTALMGGILIQFSDTTFVEAFKKIYEAGAEAEREASERKFMRLQSLMDIRETQPNKPCCLAEREACAKLCFEMWDKWMDADPSERDNLPRDAEDCASAIRARGQA